MAKQDSQLLTINQDIPLFLQKFEDNFDPVHPENSDIPVIVLGCGEISTVISFNVPGFKTYAFKRLPLFFSEKEARHYCGLYREYNQQLSLLGIETPESDAWYVKGHNGLFVAYLAQERLDERSIGNNLLHSRTDKEIQLLFKQVVQSMVKLWDHNRKYPEQLLGLDSQISNWAIRDFDPEKPLYEQPGLYFIDTSTPMLRIRSEEQMNPLLFLQSAPKPLRWILKLFFLQEVMDRYYDFRLVAVDLLANLYKEQRPDLIPGLMNIVNTKGKEFLEGKRITEKEVKQYYKNDKLIWKLFLALRRADRFINSRVLGRRYEFTLPGKIKR
ncbi:hypothetical protein E7Z59_06915 [Robertkochia marina]|uniref:Uncharacterized protein n=1 Tax=Robertkochia marina TaxID=1227945 RepID=A0A4S3M028_9FLAO|nr:DUF6206 family protein [Robertkochia marina]THD67387.1 hypothetical protein E7Z59_06915 [Robertkochia marina]TRZ43041.1 hypothetical protein D3A96_11220 [Robertkochia marina]